MQQTVQLCLPVTILIYRTPYHYTTKEHTIVPARDQQMLECARLVNYPHLDDTSHSYLNLCMDQLDHLYFATQATEKYGDWCSYVHISARLPNNTRYHNRP